MTTTTLTATQYEDIAEADVPAGLIWITPARHQGQAVEIQYSTGVPRGQGGNYDADHGDPYKRVTDRGDGGGVTYYRRVGR